MQKITNEELQKGASLKALVLENEPLGLKNIKSLLAHVCKKVDIVAEATSLKEGKEVVTNALTAIDFALLDIHLDDGLVFPLLPELKKKGIDFLFVSAYPQHAIKAFKLDAAHFITKPIDPDDLKEAINRVRARKKFGIAPNKEDEPDSIPENRYITLSDKNGYYNILVDDIIRCEADDVYTTFFFQNRKPLLLAKNIGKFEKRLKPYKLFFRSERSHLINRNFLDRRIIKKGKSTLIMKEGERIPLARRRIGRYKIFMD